MGIITKIGRALLALPRLNRQRCNTLVMTMLVKNEEKMLENNLKFHKAMGVDKFIITDNNSTDSTPQILEKYKEMGWVHAIIKEPGQNYMQKQWVDRMICLAIKELKADWIMNVDADEFWYTRTGSIKQELAQAKGNVVHCPIRSMYPEENTPYTQWNKRVEFVSNQADYELSTYSIFERQRGKVAHRTDGYLQIGTGNHKVTMLPKKTVETGIMIYHYNVGLRDAFIAKMVNGGKQFEQHPGKKHGRHWRYFYELYKDNQLSEEYDRVIGLHHLEELKRDGYLVEDGTMTSIFSQLSGKI